LKHGKELVQQNMWLTDVWATCLIHLGDTSFENTQGWLTVAVCGVGGAALCSGQQFSAVLIRCLMSHDRKSC